MRFAPIKTDDQLDLQALHRVRDRLMARRTALINQIRAFLLERGIVFAKSPIRLKEALPEVLENVNENLPEDAEPGRHAVERVEGPGASDCRDERRSGTDRFER